MTHVSAPQNDPLKIRTENFQNAYRQKVAHDLRWGLTHRGSDGKLSTRAFYFTLYMWDNSTTVLSYKPLLVGALFENFLEVALTCVTEIT